VPQEVRSSPFFHSPAGKHPYWASSKLSTVAQQPAFKEAVEAIGLGQPDAHTGTRTVRVVPLARSGFSEADLAAAGEPRAVSIGGPSALCMAVLDTLEPPAQRAARPLFIYESSQDMAGLWSAMHLQVRELAAADPRARALGVTAGLTHVRRVQPSGSKSMHRADRGQGLFGLDNYRQAEPAARPAGAAHCTASRSFPHLFLRGVMDFVYPASLADAMQRKYFAVVRAACVGRPARPTAIAHAQGTHVPSVLKHPLRFAEYAYNYTKDSAAHDALEKAGQLTPSQHTLALAHAAMDMWASLERRVGGKFFGAIGSRSADYQVRACCSAALLAPLTPSAGARRPQEKWSSAAEDAVLNPAAFPQLRAFVSANGGEVLKQRVTDLVVSDDGQRAVGVVVQGRSGQRIVPAASVYATFGARTRVVDETRGSSEALVEPLAAVGGSWLIMAEGPPMDSILASLNTHISPLVSRAGFAASCEPTSALPPQSYVPGKDGKTGVTLLRATDGAFVTSFEHSNLHDLRHAAKA
jgi:hypothetical protein